MAMSAQILGKLSDECKCIIYQLALKVTKQSHNLKIVRLFEHITYTLFLLSVDFV